MKELMEKYDLLEKKLKYGFKDTGLLETALTHSSFTAEHGKSYRFNNERLEFIGDAYIDAVIGKKLYDILPDEQEGVLSKDRADIVCERAMAQVAKSVGLGDFLRLGKGEAASGGREKDSILADSMEAVVGAIVLDSSYETAEKVVLDIFSENIRLAVKGKLCNDYKSMLQEKLQYKYKSPKIVYSIVGESGPDHDKSFTAEVSVNKKFLARGIGKSKKEAEQAAAKQVVLRGEF